MKKTLLTLFAMIMALVASAQTTVDFTSLTATATDDGFTLASAPYTFTAAKADGVTKPAQNGSAKDLRVYANGTFQVVSASTTMTKMVFAVSTQGKKRLTDLVPSTGSVTVDTKNWTVTWEGEATDVTFTVGKTATYGTDGNTKAGQFDVNSVEITATAAPAPKVKNYFAVSGKNGEEVVTVSSTVYEGFGFTVQLPAADKAVVGADYAKIELGLYDVASLDEKGESRYQTWEYTTSTTNKINLAEYLKYAYAMQNVTVPVTVIDGDEQKSFTYNIASTNSDYQIIGTPSSYAEASAAWTMITDRVQASRKTADDSEATVKAGTYVQIGDERVTVTADATLCEGDWSVASEKAKIQTNGVEKLDLDARDTYQAVIFLPAGSTLAVGQSQAVLLKDATITFDLRKYYDNYPAAGALTDQLTYISEKIKGDRAVAAMYAIMFFNNIVGMISAAGEVPATVEFSTTEAKLTVYPGSADAIENQTEESFQNIRAKYPNAMAVLVSGQVADNTNVLVASADGYVCQNFVLTDLSEEGTAAYAATTDWYAPADFVAVSGSYVRHNLPNGYASVCLPFALDAEMLGGAKVLTYDYYDGNVNAYFTEGETNEAGVPCNIMAQGGELTATFDMTPIVATVANGNNTYGTYTTTDDYALSYYGVKSSINKFCPLAKYLYPFRACLALNAPSTVKEINAKISGETAIETVEAAAETQDIHTISGVKVSKISKPGLYIVNGKKMFVK